SLNEGRRIGYESAETPENRIELTDDAVRFKFEQPGQRKLRVHIRVHELRVVAAPRESQISRIDFRRDLANVHIAIRIGSVEWISAVDIRAGRANQSEIHQRQRAT